jgi:Skp family chaperone for outer membrane proteins
MVTPLPPSVYQSIAYELYSKKISKIPTSAESDSRSKRKLKNNFEKAKNKKVEKVANKNNEQNKEQKDALRSFYENIENYVEDNQTIETDKLIVIYRNIGFLCLSS